MITKNEIADKLHEYFKVPHYICACSSAIYYDLMHGPSWSRIPEGDITKFTSDEYATFQEDLEKENNTDIIEETYVGIVAKTLREFINELPSELWYDQQSGEVLAKEPEGYVDEETNEYQEPYWEDYYKVDHSQIVEALFGKTIAREFK